MHQVYRTTAIYLCEELSLNEFPGTYHSALIRAVVVMYEYAPFVFMKNSLLSITDSTLIGLLGLQSHIGGKSLRIRVVCTQNGTAALTVLGGLRHDYQ